MLSKRKVGGYYQKQILNAEVRRPLDTQAIHRLVLAAAVGVLVIGGFGFSIWQHVEAVTYGYRTEQLRQERQRLDAEKRKLELEKAYRSSPEVIEKAARKLGLVRPDSSQVVVASKTQRAKDRSRDKRARSSR